ncbi:hypothetical protein TgHK011_006119 [Trichoderma gracile]|nr:hypothetical protein TgHK011_006119 [Trichoderma gracile]
MQMDGWSGCLCNARESKDGHPANAASFACGIRGQKEHLQIRSFVRQARSGPDEREASGPGKFQGPSRHGWWVEAGLCRMGNWETIWKAAGESAVAGQAQELEAARTNIVLNGVNRGTTASEGGLHFSNRLNEEREVENSKLPASLLLIRRPVLSLSPRVVSSQIYPYLSQRASNEPCFVFCIGCPRTD